MDRDRAQRRMGVPVMKNLDGSALMARVGRLAHPLPSLNRCEPLRVERLAPKQHVVDGTAQLGRENAQGFSLPVLLLQPGEVLLPGYVATQKQRGGFGEGPLEVDVAHLATRRLLDLARRLVGSLDQATIGQELLNPGKAVDDVNLIEQGQRQDLPNPGNRAQQKEAGIVILADLVNQVELHIPDDLIVGLQKLDIGSDRHLHHRVFEVLDDGSSILGLSSPLLQHREVVLGVGVLDVGEELSTLPGEEQTAPEQVPCGSHLVRIDVGLGEGAAAQQGSDLVGVNAVVFGLSAMDSLHVQGMPEDEGDVLLRAEVGDPVPAEETLDGDDEVLAVGLDDLEQFAGIAGKFAVNEGFTGLVENADVHAAGVKVDSTVMLVLLGVESHRGLLGQRVTHPRQPTVWVGRRGPQISIPCAAQDGWARAHPPVNSRALAASTGLGFP